MAVSMITPRLHLRALRPSDAGPISLYGGDRRVAQMTTSIPHPYPPGAAQSYIDAVLKFRNGQLVWAMDATRSGGAELIGLMMLKPKDGTVGYWVGPPFWNTGYASEALAAVVENAFEKDGHERLRAAVFKDNPGSRHVLEKLGFQLTGEGEGHSVGRGEMVPEWRLESTPESWRAALAVDETQPGDGDRASKESVVR